MYLQHCTRQMSVLTIHMVNQHGTTAIDTYTKSGCMAQLHLGPPLENLRHFVDYRLVLLWEKIQVDLAHRHLIHIGIPTCNGLMLLHASLSSNPLFLMVPWVQDGLQALCHLHLQVSTIICSHIDHLWLGVEPIGPVDLLPNSVALGNIIFVEAIVRGLSCSYFIWSDRSHTRPLGRVA